MGDLNRNRSNKHAETTMHSANSSRSSTKSQASAAASSSSSRYRTKAKTSEVDELLFGSNSRSSTPKSPSPTEEKSSTKKDNGYPTLHFTAGAHLPKGKNKVIAAKPETIRGITKDLIRDSFDFLSWKANQVEPTEKQVKQHVDAEKDKIM